MNDMNLSPDQPIFFMPNRVWRCYTGGVLLDRFVGNAAQIDDHFPEDWIGSTVVAMNGDHSQGVDEGLARVRLGTGEPGPLFKDLLASDPAGFLGPRATSGELSILCKYLDSAVRLPIQCHPDVPFAQKHYQSNHGKTEAWVILDTRAIDGEEPYLLMGFKPGITAEDFAEAVATQDIAKMEAMLHRVPARVGDVWFIPGRFPHAIGSGVFLMEVQEPSDWVVQPEAKCADTCLTPADMWGPLTPEVGLKCFEYEGMTVEQVSEKCLLMTNERFRKAQTDVAIAIGSDHTKCFCVFRMDVPSVIERFSVTKPYRIELVTEGEGELVIGDNTIPVKKGDVYFLPHGVREVTYRAKGDPLSIYAFMPGS
jgi:mannose-6-phosphate isomerase